MSGLLRLPGDFCELVGMQYDNFVCHILLTSANSFLSLCIHNTVLHIVLRPAFRKYLPVL
jgi:hypothetical protein